MKHIDEITQSDLQIVRIGADGFQAYLLFPPSSEPAAVIASWGGGWEHVSMSFCDRCPTWSEMCKVKEIFWNDEECVVQFHPPKSKYVNNHPYCLHLWRKIGAEFEVPPSILVGLKGVGNLV
jgi:hypothetical protein